MFEDILLCIVNAGKMRAGSYPKLILNIGRYFNGVAVGSFMTRANLAPQLIKIDFAVLPAASDAYKIGGKVFQLSESGIYGFDGACFFRRENFKGKHGLAFAEKLRNFHWVNSFRNLLIVPACPERSKRDTVL